MYCRENVVAIIFTNNPETSFLLLQRSPIKGGFWQPVTGGIEPSESLIDALKREIYEETGLSHFLKIIDLNLSYEFETSKNNTHMKMRDICFAVEVEHKTPIQLSNEHIYYKWCKGSELTKYITWECSQLAYQKLLSLL